MPTGACQSNCNQCTLRTMISTTGRFATPLLVVAAMLGRVAAEAPLAGYNYPSAANTLNANNQLGVTTGLPAAIINNGVNGGIGTGYSGNNYPIKNGDYPYNRYNNNGNYPAYNRYNNNEYQDVDVQKHVYVHVAPEDPIEQRAPVIVNGLKPKKHYKIVFIKAPSSQPIAPAYVNLPPPDQEKTLIYVLSKRPELQQSVVVSTPAPTVPSKPEVYFIRYKNNKEISYPGGPGVRPLSDSYGVPLGTPLNGLQYASKAPVQNAL